MYAVTQTVQIRGMIMTATAAAYTAVVPYDRFAPHEKRAKKIKKLKICQSCQYVNGQ